jgi:hypothetical protein
MVVVTISPAAKSGVAGAAVGEAVADGLGVGIGVGLGDGEADGDGVGVRGGGKVQAPSTTARTMPIGPLSLPTHPA